MTWLFSVGMALFCFPASPVQSPHQKCADLQVVEIREPLWEKDYTSIAVVIKNIGKQKSEPTIALAYDLDLHAEQARELGFSAELVEAIEENNSLAVFYKSSKSLGELVDESSLDHDRYWECRTEIPAIRPGKSVIVYFNLPQYWIYDPNCEIQVVLDPEELIKDCDRKNNVKGFIAWG